MKNKNNKNGIITTTVITAVVLILLNVCTFVIPFNKIDMAVHFTVYGCAEFVILAEMALILTQMFGCVDPNQKIISLPIAFFGYVIAVIQILVTAGFYLANAFMEISVWVVVIVECILIGFGIVQIVKGFFFKARNAEYHENIANTKFMDEFRARLKALSRINKNENIEKILDDLLDISLGSDPITNDKTVDSESELLSLLQELDDSIKNGSEDEARDIIEKTRNALLERNVLCKAGK